MQKGLAHGKSEDCLHGTVWVVADLDSDILECKIDNVDANIFEIRWDKRIGFVVVLVMDVGNESISVHHVDLSPEGSLDSSNRKEEEKAKADGRDGTTHRHDVVDTNVVQKFDVSEEIRHGRRRRGRTASLMLRKTMARKIMAPTNSSCLFRIVR